MPLKHITSRKYPIALATIVCVICYLNIESRFWSTVVTSAKETIFSTRSLPQVEIKPHNRWIVVTTINRPTEDVKRLAASGWNLVVVGDTKTPNDWFLEGVHFLSVEDQLNLGLSLPKLLPYRTYTRKNIGYLYAIMKGAQWIYDTDDDNKPYGLGLEQFTYETNTYGLRWQPTQNSSFGNNVLNPYSYFGNPGMWPRGFPLKLIGNHSNGIDRMVLCRDMKTPVVQQGLVHKDPDVDAIYRLLHADKNTGLNVEFDSHAAPVTLDIGAFSPWNSQNTLFHSKAFFTLLLPASVEFRVTDIWRSYFSQKLLHLIGESMAFYPVNAVQIRNAHNYLEDFIDEKAVYLKSGEIIEFLANWTCTANSTEECTIQLAEQFRDRQFWEQQDVDLVRAWITDLKNIGYEFPSIALPNKYEASDLKDSNCHRAHLDFSQNRIQKSIVSRVQNFEEILNFCDVSGDVPNVTLPIAANIEESQNKNEGLMQKSRTALILTANWPWKYGIGMLQRLYEPYFAVVVFCGTWNKTLYNAHEMLPKIRKPFNYIHLSQEQINRGIYGYYCLSKARDLKLQNIDGYYLVADDSIFNLWVSNSQDRSTIPDDPAKYKPAHWNGPNGKSAATDTLTLITQKYANNFQIQELWKEFNKRVKHNGHNKTGSEVLTEYNGRSMSDFVYITASDVDFVADMYEVFSEGKLYLETATAKIRTALNFTTPNYRYLWGRHRGLYENSYNSSLLFLHPIKLGILENRRRQIKRYCETVVKTFKENMYS